MIWDMALLDEEKDRVIIDTHINAHSFNLAIAPLKELISPFLSVNRESRECALAIYDEKVEMRVFPVPKSNILDSPNPLDLTLKTSFLMQDGGRAKGEIYISPEYDNFILLRCHDQAEPDAVERKVLTWGYKGTLDPREGVISRYVLAELPIAIPKRVGTLTLAAKRSPFALFFACDFSTVKVGLHHYVEEEDGDGGEKFLNHTGTSRVEVFYFFRRPGLSCTVV